MGNTNKIVNGATNVAAKDMHLLTGILSNAISGKIIRELKMESNGKAIKYDYQEAMWWSGVNKIIIQSGGVQNVGIRQYGGYIEFRCYNKLENYSVCIPNGEGANAVLSFMSRKF
jgi:hypothetical protein